MHLPLLVLPVLLLAVSIPPASGSGLTAPRAASGSYAQLDSLIATRLDLTRQATDGVEAVANALRTDRLSCRGVTIALPALGEVTPISATPAPTATVTAAITATAVLSPTAAATTTASIALSATAVTTDSTPVTMTASPSATALPTSTVIATATAPATVTASVTPTASPIATSVVPTATPVVLTMLLGHVATRRALFGTLGLASHLGALAPQPEATATSPSGAPAPITVLDGSGTTRHAPDTAAANGEWSSLTRRESLLSRLLPVQTPDLFHALVKALFGGPSGDGAGLLTPWVLPPSQPAALEVGPVYTFAAAPEDAKAAAVSIRVSGGGSLGSESQTSHVIPRAILAAIHVPVLRQPIAAPREQVATLAAGPGQGAARRVGVRAPPVAQADVSGNGSSAAVTSTAVVTTGPGIPEPTVTPTATAILNLGASPGQQTATPATPSPPEATATPAPSPTPANTLTITETTGSLTLVTAAGTGRTAYDADERTLAATLGAAAVRHHHQKPRYFRHVWVNMVLVSRWTVPSAARAASLLHTACEGPAVAHADQLGTTFVALARVQDRGDRLNAQLRAAYRGVYGVFLGALEQVAVRNLNRRTWWYGLVVRYRGYLSRYHAWEAREKAYWRWRAALFAHQQAVAAWHARQAAYDRFAADLTAYKAALPGYYADVQEGRRTRVPPPPAEPAWPGSAPAFFLPEPLRLPRPYYVPIPPAPPYMEPSPEPPAAPPEWEMLVTANLRGIGRLGSPWSRSFWVNAREDQMQEARAFEGVPAFVTPLHGPVMTCFGCSNWLMPFHSGLDIAAPIGTPIVAAADGVVRFAGYSVPGRPDQQYGLCLIIQYNQYISSLYAHLNDNIGLLVYPGQTIHRGQTVAFVGMTGFTSGPHLHFEMRFQGHPFDPMLAPGIRP
ncbi:MAG: hypothetical protein NVSMB65_03730 [Chloroflexota bacterium]